MSSTSNLNGKYNAIAGSYTGIWYSSDSGETWTLSSNADGNLTSYFTSLYMVGTNAIAGPRSDTGIWYSVKLK